MTQTTAPDDRDALLRQLMLERHEPIAVIGMGIRFPGDNDTPEGLADFLREGRSGVRPLPDDRWDLTPFGERIGTPGGGFLNGIDQFDPQFFNISPKEANWIDPQQRLLLETAWRSLENANLDPAALRHGNGGVFVGASSLDYAFELDSLPYDALDPSLANGMTIYPMSGRLSYFLGWRGPSLSTDTACASSLTAVHLAVTSLRRRECDIALAGAVNCIHHPRLLVIFTHGDVFAADGRCKTFDDAADGYARAEGCGVLTLKRLSDARRDGDEVLALIRGTAIGQDGESAGLTAPNGVAQEAVMRAAIANAMLTPADIGYVEAHGTGTPLGDPIEMASINAVLGPQHSPDNPVLVGSLKANIGHMEPVAGIGGIVKSVLQLRGKEIFPHLLDKLSARIPWDAYPVRIPTAPEPWNAPVRRAMVNGFGFAGAIGVVVLEQAPEAPVRPPQPHPAAVLALSARSHRALGLQLESYLRHAEADPGLDARDLAYTSAIGRGHFGHRVAGVVRDRADLVALLRREAERHAEGAVTPRDVQKVAFLFSGSGGEHQGMGAALYEQFPVFREHVDAIDALFVPLVGRSVRDLMLGRAGDAADFRVLRYNQPIMFMFEYALAQLWMSFGIRPSVVIGHSTGELVAATVAGVFSLADGARLMAARGRLIEQVTERGGMAAIGAPAEVVEPYLAEPFVHGRVIVGAVNSPGQSVLSGAAEPLAVVCARLAADGFQVTPLKVPVASHSPLMGQIAEPLREVLAGIPMRPPVLALVSNSTGEVARAADITTPEYWVRHICRTLHFMAGIRTIERRGRHAFVEIGPATALISPGVQCVESTEHVWVSSTHPDDPDGSTLRASLAELYTAGLPVDWRAVYGAERYRTVRLPNYAFDRRRYWLPNDATRHRANLTSVGGGDHHPLLGAETSTPAQRGAGVREFVTRLSSVHPAHLAHHRTGGRPFVAVAVFLEAMLALQDAVHGETSRPIEDLVFHETLFLPGDGGVDVFVRYSTLDGTVEIGSRRGTDEHRHVTARLGAVDASDPQTAGPGAEAPRTQVSADEVYAVYAAAGLDYGPAYRLVESVTGYGPELAVGTLRPGAAAGAIEHLPPPVMDAATHLLAAVIEPGSRFLAVRAERFRFWRKPKGDRLRSVLRTGKPDRPDAAFHADVVLYDGDRPVFELTGLQFAELPEAVFEESAAVPSVDGAALRAQPARERLVALRELIARALADLLHIEDPATIDPRTKFVLLGLNSLGAVELRGALERALGVALPRSVALDHPTVELLAAQLDAGLAES